MKKIALLILLFIFFVNGAQAQEVLIPETQEAYEKRIQWFIEAKYGLFIHFGLYSTLGGIWEGQEIPHLGEWIQSAADIQPQEYAMLTHSFNPSDFNAEKIAKIAFDAGMKYLVITAKHHEGFCLWNSEYTNFDVGSTPFNGRDILAELNSACRKYGLKFCIYYSILDWHHPSQIQNYHGINKDARWGQIAMRPGHKEEYLTYLRNQIKELMERYEPKLLWFDGSWPFWWAQEDGEDLYKFIRHSDPKIIVNDRIFVENTENLADYITNEGNHPEKALEYIWEACYTTNDSWGYKKNDSNWKSAEEIYSKLKDINTKGGNFLLNVGPDGYGNIPQPCVDILLEVGEILNNDK